MAFIPTPNTILPVKRLQRCHPSHGEVPGRRVQGQVLLQKRFGAFARNETGTSTLPTASTFPVFLTQPLPLPDAWPGLGYAPAKESSRDQVLPEGCSEPSDPWRGSQGDVTVGVPKKPPTSSGKLMTAPPQADEKMDFAQQFWGGRWVSETPYFSISRPKFSEFPSQGEFGSSLGFCSDSD